MVWHQVLIAEIPNIRFNSELRTLMRTPQRQTGDLAGSPSDVPLRYAPNHRAYKSAASIATRNQPGPGALQGLRASGGAYKPQRP